MIITCIGGVDVGKSSLISRILINTGAIKSNEINKTMDKHKEWLSKLVDTDENEKDRGMTLFSSIEKFTLDGKSYSIINNPGHIILSNEIIKSAYRADVCILLLSAKKNEIDKSIKIGYNHSLIGRVSGINHLIICINKSEFLNSNDNKYEDIHYKVKNAFKNIKFNTIHILPISAKLNLNISKNDSSKCDKCLFDILKSIKMHRRESRIIKIIDNCIKCKLFFHEIPKIVTIGYNSILHSGNKIFNVEFTKINNKLQMITKKNRDMINCELKINSDDHIDYAILLKNPNNNTILAYGIIY